MRHSVRSTTTTTTKRFRLTSGSLAAAGKLMQDGISSTQLLQLLLHREKLLYQNYPLSLAQGEGVIGWRERNRECAWMCTAAKRIGLGMDTASLAVAIFDRVVTSVKIPHKYVNCVAVGSLSIAKKLCEDHEEDASVFLGRLRLEYSAQELKRMELKILEVLRWDAQLPNLNRFVECLLSELEATFLLTSIRKHIDFLLCDSNLIANFRSSVLALSTVSILVESTNKHWQYPINALARLCKIPMSEVNRCRGKISSLWSRQMLPMPSTFHLLADMNDQDSDTDSDLPLHLHSSPQSPAPSSSASEHITSPIPRTLQPTPC
uniref:CYCLIN domain-containing protein n=1 Tax=Caenorhabditis japonica TaxID=281687 RepID=A0A8R1DWI4_CAEJA